MKHYTSIKWHCNLLILFAILLTQNVFAQKANHEEIFTARQQAYKTVANERKISSSVWDKLYNIEQDIAKMKISPVEFKKTHSSFEHPIDASGRMYVAVYIKEGYLEKAKNAILSTGGSIITVGFNTINCWIPILMIKELIKDESIGFINSIGKCIRNVGSVTTAGDIQLSADIARDRFYSTGGGGIKVGVISDGMQYWQNSRTTGDLPNTISYVDNSDQVSGSEGTAMMEIVHDIAPDASLVFGWCGDTPLDFANRISSLQSAGCKIIVDDIAWIYGASYFEDREIASSISYFVNNRGGTYISSAGNFAEKMYTGTSSPKTTGPRRWHQFSGTDTTLALTITGYKGLTVVMQWSDRWQETTENFDLFIYDKDEQLIASGTNGYGTPIPPEERFSIRNENGLNNGPYKIRIEWPTYNFGDVNRELKLLCLPQEPFTSSTNFSINYKSADNHIFGHQACEYTISVAAYSAFETNKVENFSSRGPSIMRYTNGSNLFTRLTPTITATDGVITKVGKDGNFGGDSLFFGTSAAAPHIAGIAALYYSRYPSNTRSQFLSAMSSSASAIGSGTTGGVHNTTSGYGKADAYKMMIKGLTVLNSPQIVSQDQYWGSRRITGTAFIGANRKAIIGSYSTALIEGNINFGSSSSEISVYGTLIIGSTATLDPAGIKTYGDGKIIGGKFVTVQVNQLDEFNSSFGMVGRLRYGKFDSANVPYSFPVMENSKEIMRASQEFKSGTTQKYWQWNNILSNVKNHRELLITKDNPNLTSYFKSANSTIIQAQLIEGLSIGGLIDFRDPWLIDQQVNVGSQIVWKNCGMDSALWYSRTSPFNPHTNPTGPGSEYKGVFLNQEIAPNKPYYTVRAPQEQVNIGGFKGFFLNWSGDPNAVTYQNANNRETPIVFKQSGATATALYKAHLGSSLSTVISPNSQRKVIQDPTGKYHLVYPSVNNIWHTTSLDGVNWTEDQPLSYWIDGASAPSITFNQMRNVTNIVWRAFDGERFKIFHSTHISSGPDIIYIASSGVAVSNPQVASLTNNSSLPDIIVWLENNTTLKCCVRHSGSNSWSNPIILISSGVQEFSLGAFGNRFEWLLAWIQNNEVRYAPINYQSGSNPTLGAQVVIAPSYDMYINSRISTAKAGIECNYPIISWECYDNDIDTRSVRVRQRGSTGWGPTTVFQAYDPYTWSGNWPKYYTPSISTHAFDNISLSWRRAASDILSVKRISGAWQSIVSLGTGVDPISSEKPMNDQYASVHLRRGTGSVFPILRSVISTYVGGGGGSGGSTEIYVPGTISNEGLKESSLLAKKDPSKQPEQKEIQFIEGRGVSIVNGESAMQLFVRASKAVQFGALNDTIPVTKSDVLSILTSEPFESDGAVSVDLNIKSKGKKSSLPSIRVALEELDAFDKPTGKMLGLKTYRPVSNISEKVQINSGSAKKRVRLVAAPVMIPAEAEVDASRILFVIDDDSSDSIEMMKQNTEQQAVISLPMETALTSNYPNPFNPSTTISYQIAGDAGMRHAVSLRVYDMLGREVAVLADGYKEAGYYTATFDASHLSTGIYFARLVATPNNGQKPFVQVRKLLLTK